MRPNPNPHPGAPHERKQLESPTPIGGVAVSAWSLDPKRRRRYLQIGFGVAALIVFIVVLFLLRDFLGAFVLGSAIAFLIQPAVARLHAAGIPRILAITLVFVAIIVALAGLVLLIVPLGVNEISQLQVQAPTLAAAAQDRLNSLQPVRVFGIDIDLKGLVATINGHLREYLLGQFGNAVTLGLTALTTALQLLLMFIVAFLLALEAPAVRRDLRRFVPNDYRTDFDQIWRKVRKMLYAYVRGQLIVAALIGVLSGLACWLAGLPDPIALGLIAGVTALIPYLGPFIGAVPAILVGLSQSPGKALLIGLLYLLISNVVLNIIYPKVVGDAVRLPPILVIVALIAGFSWGGILGMFVAVPIAATLRILFDHIYPRLYERPA
ncbi:MAG TPA: AI-2E family transporter [Candidatus Dormibacteraeota bacterium]|nr:AI-2E family transporter [Candidatus Dormibacteraeota bacterium]